jgi:hypothetical protein
LPQRIGLVSVSGSLSAFSGSLIQEQSKKNDCDPDPDAELNAESWVAEMS